MKKQIIAWAMIVGFVLLIVNITFFHFQLFFSFFVYVIIAAYFLMTNKKK